MAPSEFDLRAALHDGEGDGVDAGRVIARARAARAARRTRWASAAAAVVVVGALGTGIGALAHYGGSDSGGSASSAGGANAADSAAGTEAGALALATPQPGVPAAPSAGHGTTFGTEHGAVGGRGTEQGPSRVCEDTLPVATPSPAAGVGGSGPLLPADTQAVIVCGYRAPSSGGPAQAQHQIKLVGPDARELARSLNSAPFRPDRACAAVPPLTMLSIMVVRPDVTPHALVVVTNSPCGATATDGTAARWGWTPPADLTATLDALTRS